MRVWLVTWDWLGDHARVRDPFIAVFSSRKSSEGVAEFVEHYYLLMTSSAGEVAYFVNRRQKVPYKVDKNMVINDIPHGDRMVCGNNPFIYARLVSNFVSRADYDKASETIRWKEPSTVRWKEKSRREFVVAKEGDEQELIRELKCL